MISDAEFLRRGSPAQHEDEEDLWVCPSAAFLRRDSLFVCILHRTCLRQKLL